jgi:hypothetical protein
MYNTNIGFIFRAPVARSWIEPARRLGRMACGVANPCSLGQEVFG